MLLRPKAKEPDASSNRLEWRSGASIRQRRRFASCWRTSSAGKWPSRIVTAGKASRFIIPGPRR